MSVFTPIIRIAVLFSALVAGLFAIAPTTDAGVRRLIMQCPHCEKMFLSASAWSGPEPDCEPGVLCPHCGKFIRDDELHTEPPNQSVEPTAPTRTSLAVAFGQAILKSRRGGSR